MNPGEACSASKSPYPERMCDRACLLVHGRVDFEGEPGKVIARYREILAGEHRM